MSISSKGNKIHTYIYERRIHTYVQKLSITVVTRQMFVPQEITATGCAEVPAMFLLDLLTLFLFYYNFYEFSHKLSMLRPKFMFVFLLNFFVALLALASLH